MSKKSIVAQWERMIASHRQPILEYQLSTGDYLVVEISLKQHSGKVWLMVDFDTMGYKLRKMHDLKKSTCPEKLSYLVNDFFDNSLDELLQMIDTDIIEGFLMPNDLYCVGE